VSGVYLAMLTNAAGYQNATVFVVRDDRPAAFMYQQSIATDQAYNNYPNDNTIGKSLYTYNSFGANTVSGERRAVKVSFDRPYRDYGFGSAMFDSIEFIRWIERSGYDVTYATDVDVHANGAALRTHKGVLVVGHDEYWSKEMFDAHEAARDAGVGLAFFAADTATVQIRYESGASGAPNRVIVCYKDWPNDPASPGPTTTVKFRDYPVNRPEQSLRGVMSDWMLSGQDNAPYVVQNSSHWIYAGTGFHDGDSVPGIVGYEMDSYHSQYPTPTSSKWTLLSNSPFNDFQGVPRVSNASIYQAPSGAWVFSSGTISWSWALDGLWHQRTDARIQRTTANLLDAFVNGVPLPPPPSPSPSPSPSPTVQLTATGPASAAAGVAFTVNVAAVDAQGQPVTSYAGTVHFSSTDTSPNVVLPADSRLTNGQKAFSVTLATVGSQTVTVSDANSHSATVAVNVTAGPADHLTLATTTTPIAGASFSFTVTAVDRFGNTATDYAGRVHFTSSDKGATLPADSTLANGQGQFSATLKKSGPQTITAKDTHDASITGQLSVTVRAGGAVALVLAGPPTATAGTAFQFTVEAQDQFGNTDTGYAGRVHFSSSDTSTGVVLPADATLANGQGTFSATLTKAGAQTITGTDVAQASITGNFAITVQAAAASTLVLDTPASVAAGQTFPVTVTLRDAFGNVATGYQGTVGFATDDPLPTVVLPADYTFTAADAGSHSFSVRLWTMGNRTLTAADKAKAALSDTNTVAVRPSNDAVALTRPIHDDLAALTAAHNVKRLREVFRREAMRDDRRDVEAALQHRAHAVPRLEHLATVDTLEGEAAEDHLIPVDRDLLARDPEQGDASTVIHELQHRAQRRGAS
jgi:hypothetical protein